MPQPKGKTGNPNGRRKGTPNKVTGELRERIKAFIDDNWEVMKEDFKALEPKEKVMFYEKLMAYAVPKLQSVELDANIKSTGSISIDKWLTDNNADTDSE